MAEEDPHQPNPGDTLLFENERVRIWSMTIEPGTPGDWHSHQHDHILLWPAAGKSKGQLWGQETPGITQDAEDDFVAYKAVGDGLVPHRLHNVDDHTTRHYIIELLEPSPYPEEGPYITNGRGQSHDDADGPESQAFRLPSA
jgi:beta-alanine degradation protein BauB